MNYYLDTSVLVSILTEESHTARSEQWLMAHGDDVKLISWWVDVEWNAAMSMKVRNRALDRESRALVDDAYSRLVDASFATIPLERRHFIAASDLARRSDGLRAGDALHLAIADAEGCTVCTLDVGMARAAESLGLHVHLI